MNIDMENAGEQLNNALCSAVKLRNQFSKIKSEENWGISILFPEK